MPSNAPAYDVPDRYECSIYSVLLREGVIVAEADPKVAPAGESNANKQFIHRPTAPVSPFAHEAFKFEDVLIDPQNTISQGSSTRLLGAVGDNKGGVPSSPSKPKDEGFIRSALFLQSLEPEYVFGKALRFAKHLTDEEAKEKERQQKIALLRQAQLRIAQQQHTQQILHQTNVNKNYDTPLFRSTEDTYTKSPGWTPMLIPANAMPLHCEINLPSDTPPNGSFAGPLPRCNSTFIAGTVAIPIPNGSSPTLLDSYRPEVRHGVRGNYPPTTSAAGSPHRARASLIWNNNSMYSVTSDPGKFDPNTSDPAGGQGANTWRIGSDSHLPPTVPTSGTFSRSRSGGPLALNGSFGAPNLTTFPAKMGDTGNNSTEGSFIGNGRGPWDGSGTMVSIDGMDDFMDIPLQPPESQPHPLMSFCDTFCKAGVRSLERYCATIQRMSSVVDESAPVIAMLFVRLHRQLMTMLLEVLWARRRHHLRAVHDREATGGPKGLFDISSGNSSQGSPLSLKASPSPEQHIDPLEAALYEHLKASFSIPIPVTASNRLLAACIMLGTKLCSDKRHDCKYFATLTGLGSEQADLPIYEYEALKVLGFEHLFVHPEHLDELVLQKKKKQLSPVAPAKVPSDFTVIPSGSSMGRTDTEDVGLGGTSSSDARPAVCDSPLQKRAPSPTFEPSPIQITLHNLNSPNAPTLPDGARTGSSGTIDEPSSTTKADVIRRITLEDYEDEAKERNKMVGMGSAMGTALPSNSDGTARYQSSMSGNPAMEVSHSAPLDHPLVAAAIVKADLPSNSSRSALDVMMEGVEEQQALRKGTTPGRNRYMKPTSVATRKDAAPAPADHRDTLQLHSPESPPMIPITFSDGTAIPQPRTFTTTSTATGAKWITTVTSGGQRVGLPSGDAAGLSSVSSAFNPPAALPPKPTFGVVMANRPSMMSSRVGAVHHHHYGLHEYPSSPTPPHAASHAGVSSFSSRSNTPPLEMRTPPMSTGDLSALRGMRYRGGDVDVTDTFSEVSSTYTTLLQRIRTVPNYEGITAPTIPCMMPSDYALISPTSSQIDGFPYPPHHHQPIYCEGDGSGYASDRRVSGGSEGLLGATATYQQSHPTRECGGNVGRTSSYPEYHHSYSHTRSPTRVRPQTQSTAPHLSTASNSQAVSPMPQSYSAGMGESPVSAESFDVTAGPSAPSTYGSFPAHVEHHYLDPQTPELMLREATAEGNTHNFNNRSGPHQWANSKHSAVSFGKPPIPTTATTTGTSAVLAKKQDEHDIPSGRPKPFSPTSSAHAQLNFEDYM